MMLRLLISMLSTLLISSRGLLSFAPGLRTRHTQALPLISSPPVLNLSVPSIPPTFNNPFNLTTWPPPPIRCYAKDNCIIDITAISMPSPQASSLDVLYHIIGVRQEIDNICEHYEAFLPVEIFEHGPVRIDFVTPLPNQMLCTTASNIIDTLWELLYGWGIMQLTTVQVSTFGGISYSVLSLEILTDSISPRNLPPSTKTSQPSPSQQSNLTLWPPTPFVRSVTPDTIISINAVSVAAGMPSAAAIFEALNRLRDYLDGLYPSPDALLPQTSVSHVRASPTTGVSVTFSSEEGDLYTWSLARSVLLAVAAMERTYGSVQLDDVTVSVEGDRLRSFKLAKFDRHWNIILPRTLQSSSLPSLGLSTNQTLISTSLQMWPYPPINVVIIPGRVTLTVTKLTPVQDYPTIKADIQAMHDELEAEGDPQDELPLYVGLRKGRLTVLFYSTALIRSIALQVLDDMGDLEGFHGAAEFQRAGLVIDGKQGGFSLGISRVGADGLNEDADPTVSRRSLPSNNKESFTFSLLSPSQNLTVHDLPANLTAWPPLPKYFRIDENLFINITAISPAARPHHGILYIITDMIDTLVSSSEPSVASLPLITTVLELDRVRATWTSVEPYRLTYGIAIAIMDEVLELEGDYGIMQLENMEIVVGRDICGRFSLKISDPPPPPPSVAASTS